MAYSTIIQKPCKCGCGRMPTLGYAGYNYACRPDIVSAKIEKQKARNSIRAKISPSKVLGNIIVPESSSEAENDALELQEMAKAEFAPNLATWFRYHMANRERKCENCGKYLWGLNNREWRGSQHHILWKAHFPSVKLHYLNHAVLGFYCCHPLIHQSLSQVTKMSLHSLLTIRVKLLLPYLTESHSQLNYLQ